MKTADQLKVIVLSFLSIVVMVGVITLVSLQTTKVVASHGAGHGEEHGATGTEHHEESHTEEAHTEVPADDHSEVKHVESAAPADATHEEKAPVEETHAEAPPVEAAKTVAVKGDAEAGKAVFLKATSMCVTCHTVDGLEGAVGTIGPKLNGLGERAATRVAGQDALTYIKASIEEPNAYVVESYAPAMPPLKASMSDEDFENLVAYLVSL